MKNYPNPLSVSVAEIIKVAAKFQISKFYL